MTFEDICWTVGLTVVAGVASIEVYDWSGRVAEKVLPVAARLWTKDSLWRQIYAEAWRADIEDCPGKVWRLVTAASFLGRGLLRLLARTGTGLLRKVHADLVRDLSRNHAWSTAMMFLTGTAATAFTTNALIYQLHLSVIWSTLIIVGIVVSGASVARLGGFLTVVARRRWRRVRRRRERML